MQRKVNDVFRGDRLREVRKQRGLTESQLAVLIGGKQQQIADYETKNRYPRTDTLVKIASALKCSTDYLLDLSSKPNEQMPGLSGKQAALLKAVQNGLDIEAVKALLSFLEGDN